MSFFKTLFYSLYLLSYPVTWIIIVITFILLILWHFHSKKIAKQKKLQHSSNTTHKNRTKNVRFLGVFIRSHCDVLGLL